MKKVAILDTVHQVLSQGLEQAGWECFDLTEISREDIEILIPEFNGIIVRSRFPLDSAFLGKARKLEFIARSGAGLENIDVDFCEENGIQLFNAPEGNRNAVAEHALAMLLGLFNKIIKGNREVREGIWDREGNRGIELAGKTVGIIGYGNNGSAFAKLLGGFDTTLVAYDKYKTGFGNERVLECSLNELLNVSDVISLHIPQTEETIELVDDAFIDRASHPFFLINLSRGKIVSTEALVKGLENGKVLGACLDVLEYEKASFENMFDHREELPPAFKAILESDKVILSPHVGGWTEESYYKLSKVLLDKITLAYDLTHRMD